MEQKIKKKRLIRKGQDGVKNGILFNAFKEFFNGNSSRWPMARNLVNKDTSANPRHMKSPTLGRYFMYKKGDQI